MARELILIPKMKYDQLMNNEKKGLSHEIPKEVHTSSEKNLQNSENAHQSKVNAEENKLKNDSTAYIQMKTKDFMKSKTVVNSKQKKKKWTTFQI